MTVFKITPSEERALEQIEYRGEHGGATSVQALVDNLATLVRDAEEAWLLESRSDVRKILIEGAKIFHNAIEGKSKQVVDVATQIYDRFKVAVVSPPKTPEQVIHLTLPPAPTYTKKRSRHWLMRHGASTTQPV